MSEKLKAGIVGGTGMVGQRFVQLLDQHPWFEVTAIAASKNSAGKTYEESVLGRWKMVGPIPEAGQNNPRAGCFAGGGIRFAGRFYFLRGGYEQGSNQSAGGSLRQDGNSGHFQ